MRPKKDGMDYNADIPFEKQPAPGFYDTTQEKNKFVAAPVGKNLRQLDSHKRTRAEDEEERRKRARKAKENAADKDASAHFVPAKDSLIQRQKEEANILKRRKLMLPEPQVGEAELEDIVKIGQAGETAKGLVEEGGEGASQGGPSAWIANFKKATDCEINLVFTAVTSALLRGCDAGRKMLTTFS